MLDIAKLFVITPVKTDVHTFNRAVLSRLDFLKKNAALAYATGEVYPMRQVAVGIMDNAFDDDEDGDNDDGNDGNAAAGDWQDEPAGSAPQGSPD